VNNRTREAIGLRLCLPENQEIASAVPKPPFFPLGERSVRHFVSGSQQQQQQQTTNDQKYRFLPTRQQLTNLFHMWKVRFRPR
jgi:hypothetical protein